jgi:hypothetical protein
LDAVFSMRPVPRLYNEDTSRVDSQSVTHELRVDSWSNELVLRHSPAGKDVSTEAEDIVVIRY